MEAEIIDLFSIPVLKYKLGREFTKQELNYILGSGLEENYNNSVSIEKFVLESEELKDIKLFFNKCLENYIEVIINPKNKITPYITESWINVTEKGESHHKHVHPNSFISGVFYISADEKEDKIYFHRSNQQYILNVETKDYNLYNSDLWWLPAVPGILYIFPSTLPHEVATTTSDVVRISLSFNTFLKGIIETTKTASLVLE